MRNNWVMALTAMLQAASSVAQDATTLKTPKEKISYALGVDLARNLQRQGTEVEADVLARGLKDALAGSKLLVSDDEIRNIVVSLQSQAMRNNRQSRAIASRENASVGAMFLMQNKTNAGIVVLPSGLQYRILKAGDGPKPADADTVECRYRGTLIDGTQFEASPADGPPASFRFSEVIPGWKEALKLMPVGSKWQLFIPPQLGYGLKGNGREIGPNTTLLFELELVRIK
jgi:FKBP-type peptidyl-prolyl cis-trans isomerase